MTAKELQKKLTFDYENTAAENPEEMKAAFAFAEGYKKFLGVSKTEREFVHNSVNILEMAGYKPFDAKKRYQAGDKVYFNNRGKSLIMTTFGTKPLTEGLRMNAAHIDSPRLDLKAHPVFEKDGLAFFKPHYYGGIRKYQWATIPLAMHGVFIRDDGTTVPVSVGEDDADPKFYISDLLPHLSSKQDDRKLRDGLRGEELNIIAGSLPYPKGDEEKLPEAVKLNLLNLLHEKFGITEKDFVRAEIEFVPAAKPSDIGFDRALIGAYGQDDKVCAYPALQAEMDTENPEYTTVTVFADKEEIGSMGNTGLNSDFLLHYVEDLAEMAGVNVREVLRKSICLSSDVGAAFDPTFADAYEKNNSCFLGRGVGLFKYTGARGKSGSNDASAELMAKVIGMMDKDNVHWQTGELGAVDMGGGGTVALFIAGKDVNVVDLGVPVLAMHSPFEITSKLDVYSAYCAYKAFYRN
jgi:aspartyl aminopeptidase